MSIENHRTRKSNLWTDGEDRREKTKQSSESFQQSGAVRGDSMLGREAGIRREISARETKVSTRDTTSNKKEVVSARGEVGVLHSSEEARVTSVERRRGSCANATKKQDAGLERKITFTNQLTWKEVKELQENKWETINKQEMKAPQETEPMDKVRKLQRMLYWQAKRNPKWRAWTLYGDLCSKEILEDALQKVMANKGGPGVDGMRIEELKYNKELREKFLKQLEEDLRNKTYKPQLIRRVMIPKPDGKLRPLGIPTVRDRVLQTAVVTTNF